MTRDNMIGVPERRFYEVETRANNAEDNKMRISGNGAVFGQYANMGWYVEKIEPGFLTDASKEECACLFNHDVNIVLGRMKSGTMGLEINDKSLGYWSNPPQSRADVYELVQRGDIYQSSFAFITKKARWEQLTPDDLRGIFQDWEIERLTYGGKIDLRILESANALYDVSPVTYPAYRDTSADAKAGNPLKEERDAFFRANKIFPVNIPVNETDQRGWLDYIEACKADLAGN